MCSSTLLPTPHFCQRKAQRSIRDLAIQLALQRGKRFFEGEDQVYFLPRRAIPSELGSDLARKFDGTVVILRGDVLITTFRNPRYIAQLKRRQ